MPFSTSTELLTWLSENYFLNPQQVDQLRAWSAGQPDLHAFCKELLRRDWLTAYQVNQLLKNQGETLIVGANRIHSRLGEGAMGQVFRAWNVRLGRMVAVKMLHADHALSGKAMDRFRREMQTAAALVHPNIVLLRDADETNNVPYLVMDYFDCIDLAKKMRQEGPQPIKQAVDYIRQAAAGLQHAFERGVVHRDIKPSNMLLVKGADGSSVVKILDFGLAKFEREAEGQQPLTQAGRLIGTVDYIAPEQAVDAHGADIRADIYSLGCTLFYFLTGRAPFPGADHLEKLTARIQGASPRLREFRPDAPASLEDVLLKMMAREPNDRYQTPLDAMNALAPFARDAPLAAPVVRTGAAPVAIPVGNQGGAPLAVAWPEVQTVSLHDAESQTDLPFGDAPPPAFDRSEAVAKARRHPEDEGDDSPSAGVNRWILFGTIGAIALVLVVGIGFFVASLIPATKPPLGTLAIQLDSPPGRVWAKGERKPIIVKIAREGFTGPVTVKIDPCPPWISCNPVKIQPNQSKNQLDVIIRHHDIIGPQKITIVASSPESHPASIDYEMDIIPFRGFIEKSKNGGS